MTNCEWLNSKLESYYCDALGEQELQRFKTHLASCADCRQEVESLNSIDPMVRRVMQHRLAIAQMAVRGNGRPGIVKFALAAGTLAAALLLLLVGLRFLQQPPAPTVAITPPEVQSPLEPGIKKDSTESDPGLGKPGLGKPLDGTPAQPAPQPHLDEALANGPDFAITDAAGYTATLDTYRGRVLLFGVVSSDQKSAVSNLQQVYEAFGSNPGVRILAVARHREDAFRGARFPLFFNNGSKLLGVREGQFMLLDAAGKSRLEGSLSDSASVAHIRTELGQLGVR